MYCNNAPWILYAHVLEAKLLLAYIIVFIHESKSNLGCKLNVKHCCKHSMSDKWQRILLLKSKVQMFIFGILNENKRSCTIIGPPMNVVDSIII